MPAVEFLDPDGSYALVQPFDEVRGRVLVSNVLEKGSVLHKKAELTWTEAAEDLGGFTRLGPSSFLENCPVSEGQEEDDEDQVRWPQIPGGSGGEESLDPLLGLESPSPGLATPAQESEPVGLLLRLVRHLRKQHLKKNEGSSWVAPCRCPAFQIKSERLRTRLGELLHAALDDERLPRLSRILKALRASLLRRMGAA